MGEESSLEDIAKTALEDEAVFSLKSEEKLIVNQSVKSQGVRDTLCEILPVCQFQISSLHRKG